MERGDIFEKYFRGNIRGLGERMVQRLVFLELMKEEGVLWSWKWVVVSSNH